MMQLIDFILKPYFVFDDDFNMAVWSFFQSHGLHMKYVSYAMLNTPAFITFVYNDAATIQTWLQLDTQRLCLDP